MKSLESKIRLTVIITTVIVYSLSYYLLKTENKIWVLDKKSNFTLSSKEYAIMGQKSWSAFQCANWASKIGQQNDAEKLFMTAYNHGKIFLEALMAKKIDEKDISAEVPMGITLFLQGPNTDFILGRIFESAQESALKEVYKTGNDFNSEELQKSIAENKYRDGNCKLLNS